MIIGILSDSHDNLVKIDKAVKLFNRKKVKFVLHAGDFIAPFSVIKLKDLTCDWRGVFGNNDGEKNGLSKISSAKIKEGPLRMELLKKRITLVHDIKTINPNMEKADLIVCGHSHKPEVLKLDSRLVVNPGECGGWLSGKPTVAIVDLCAMSCQIVKI